MPSLKVSILGTVSLTEQDQERIPSSSRTRAVLLALASSANNRASVDHLCEVLWDAPPRSATRNLRTYVSQLRRQMGAHQWALRTHRGGAGGSGEYELMVDRHHIDLCRFRDLTQRANLLQILSIDKTESFFLFERSLRLWRSNLGPGLPMSRAIHALCTGINLERAAAIERFTQLAIDLGHGHFALPDLIPHIVRHPDRARAHELFRVVEARTRQAEALGWIDAYRRRFPEHVSTSPIYPERTP
jgi:hypothetical protein